MTSSVPNNLCRRCGKPLYINSDSSNSVPYVCTCPPENYTVTKQPNTGSAELRRLAEQARGWPNTNIADYLDILAAAWEADRAALVVETLVRQKYGDQLYAVEAEIEQAARARQWAEGQLEQCRSELGQALNQATANRSALDDIRQCKSGMYYCAWAEPIVRRAERAEAALERARALEDAHRLLFMRLEWAGDDDDNQCPICLNTRKEGHAEKCELAAALSAPDGKE